MRVIVRTSIVIGIAALAIGAAALAAIANPFAHEGARMICAPGLHPVHASDGLSTALRKTCA